MGCEPCERVARTEFVDAHSCPWYPKTSPHRRNFPAFDAAHARGKRAFARASGLGSGSVFDEAAFVGQGRRFQIWEPNRFTAHFEEAKARVRGLRAEMGFPVAQGAWE